ncbi:uncharacterized protein PgNI_00937, partial [Pyricularia grisea]|uniref:Uncharacterized protein n=1 Tax=Pyricularia grisea TaxID=148305 RepID=A0A6P8BI17_PYRGI
MYAELYGCTGLTGYGSRVHTPAVVVFSPGAAPRIRLGQKVTCCPSSSA